MAEYAEKKVLETESLELLAPRQSFTICFRYKPSFNTDLNLFNLNLREKLRKGGLSIVNYGFMGETLALRLVIANGEICEKDLDLFFDNIIDAGRILESNGSNG
jgi:glutamate/tyrosine decarboxylase-like PLP-dependent enzyme